MEEKITIYTDGAAKGNPGKAGWGAVVLFGQNSGDPKGAKGIREIGGKVDHATNNQMELKAAIEALKYVKKNNLSQPSPGQERAKGEVEIVSDSKYVILGVTEWILNWEGNGWRSAGRKPVLNRELWEELSKLNKELRPKWRYVKGHNGDKYNSRADEIAASFADGTPIKLKNAG